MLFLFLLVFVSLGPSHQQFILPSIKEFTSPVNVYEDPTKDTELADIKPTTNSSPIDSCDVTSHPNGPFDATRKCSSNFCVHFNANSDLDYKTTNFYELNVTCTYNTIQSNTVRLFVYVLPNRAPVITNYRSDSTTLNVKTFSFSTATAYTLEVKDPEMDPLTITLTNQVPNMGLFVLDSMDKTKVKVTKDLRCITEPSYLLTFRVSDGIHVINDFKVAVTLENLNMFPYIKNLPTGVYIPEDASGGTLLTLAGEDPDNYPGPTTTTCSTSPAADNAKFPYNSGDNTIKLSGSVLDYETKDTYTITCVINDGCKPSDGSDKLTIYVQNVFEGVAFNSSDYNCNLKEGGTRSQSCILPLAVTDRDNFPVSISLEPSADSDKFYYDKNTMRVYLNDPYDVDMNLMPTTAELFLKVVDMVGSSATAPVHVTISDANDNTCHFNKDLSYTMADQSTPTGVLDSFLITDDDLTTPNKDANVNIVSSSPKDCGNFIQVSNQGDVSYVSNFPSSRSGTSCIMVINCKDKGVPSKSSLATVIVSYTEIFTTTTSTAASTTTVRVLEKDLWDYGWFVAVFSLLMLCVFAAIVALVAFALYKCCCQKSPGTVETPRNKIRPISPNDGSVKRTFSAIGDENDDDFFGTSFRSDNNNQRLWGTPRQIPALEYK